MPSSLSSPRARLLAATLASLVAAIPAAAAGAGSPPPGEELPFADTRADALLREADPSAAQEALRRSLGRLGVVDVDPLTGTPRVVARLDGFLTGPAEGDAAALVLAYVRANRGAFRLDEDDLATLRLVRDETDAAGVRHLLWAQEAGGVPAFDNDLRASVLPDGRIVNVMGSPVPDLELPAGGPALTAREAVASALSHAGADDGRRAGLVLLHDGREARLAWRVTAAAGAAAVYQTLVDAESGEVLRLANKVEDVDAMGEAWDYYPGAANGGTPVLSNWTAKGWLPADATTLDGPYARVFADVDDDDEVGLGEEAAESDSTWDYVLDEEQHPEGFCAPTPPFTSVCTWDAGSTASWSTNRKQNSAQVFHFVNTFHDHLKNDPDIAWTTRTFENGDRVVAHSNDGASTGVAGVFLGELMPDVFHVSNANMLTFPDGTSPRMQMYLFTSFTDVFATDPTPDVNGGDDAAVVYHEYAHGLSNRLITYFDGWGALDAFQSGAMGEGWSDWYALDYLVAEGLAPDTAADGDVILERYLGNGTATLRTEGLDCPVAPASAACPGGADTGPEGGYTLGDLGRIWSGGPEVHADGEIWAQTLWDLRGAVGVSDARFLITEAMRLSPTNPSFLDMRNAILQANQIGAEGGRTDHRGAIWDVFAGRGMGYFAAVESADDTAPLESFVAPPDPGDGVGSLAGTVRDADTGAPLAGVRVEFAGLGDLSDTTNASGAYSISDVPVGTYPKVVASKTGYTRAVSEDVVVAAEAETALALQLRRDWAAFSRGGRIHAHTGPDFTAFGCGPAHAIDQSQATGWSSTTGAARSLTVKLPAFVDVVAFGVDPGAICGDDESASTAGYRIQTSKTAASGSWTTVKTGAFALAEAHALNTIPIAKRKAVRYVRFTITSNHGDPDFMDLAELEVYGKLRPACFGKPATHLGTSAANVIRGTAGANVIVGLGGRDRINGRGGKDLICGGDGADRLTGGGGVDRIDGGAGNDTIYARDGRKEVTLRGGGGTDRARRDSFDRTSSVERRF